MTAARSPRGLRGLSTEARGMLPWCLGLSAAVHVLLLASMASSAPRTASLAHAGRRSAGPISVRLVAAAPLPDEAAESLPDSRPTDPPTAQPAVPIPASAPSSASAPAPATAPTTTEAESSATDARSMAGDSVDGGYVPRPLLTVAPRADTPVVIATPPGPIELGRRVGVLVLYIDEQGRVRRIEAEPPLLPPAMERAARESFAAARFAPGQIDGQVVKSRIRVEVTFDAQSLPAASAARAASGASAAHAVSAPSAARAESGASAARAASDQRSR